jgi:hypothetical protein
MLDTDTCCPAGLCRPADDRLAGGPARNQQQQQQQQSPRQQGSSCKTLHAVYAPLGLSAQPVQPPSGVPPPAAPAPRSECHAIVAGRVLL